MKKLMIIATVAIAAIAANASNVKWGTTSGQALDYTTEGQEGLKDGTAYLVLLSNQPGAYANVTAATAALPDIDAFKTVDGVFTQKSITDAGGIIFRTGDLANGMYTPAAAEAITTGPNGTGKYYAYMVAIGSDGQSLALSNTANEFNLISATTPVSKWWNPANNAFSYAVAPEPTSGLLLLLGVAGLALRRRRA